jgi:hypothetical protein
VLLGLAVAGCMGTRAPATPATSREPALVDAQGRTYVVRSVPKTHAVRTDDHTVRMLGGVPIDVVREDDRFFYYKSYEAPPAAPTHVAPPPPPAPADALEPPTSSRLRLVPFGAGLPAAGQWRSGFRLADMNGDGHLDVVHGPSRKGAPRPVVFLGNGDGTWQRWEAARFPALPYAYGDVEVADFDGDGTADLAFAAHLRGVFALRGDGRGGFTEMRRGLDLAMPGEPLGFSSRALRAADVDGDGRPDLIALGDGPRLVPSPGEQPGAAMGAAVYRNRGDGSWERSREKAAAGLFGDSLAVGDFDGDGRPDLATASGVLGRTDIVQLGRAGGRWEPFAATSVRPRAYVRAVAAGDLDGDGVDDLAVAYAANQGATWRSGVDVLHAGAAPWRRTPIVERDGAAGPSALAIGDLDGDGRRDVVALTADGEVWIFLADGRGGFTRDAAPPPYGPGCGGSHVELGDLDGDGRLDVVAAFAHEPEAGDDVCRSSGGIVAWKVMVGS